MAYQSTEMAEKLNNAMAGRNDVATNNADPIRQMQGQVGRPQQVVAGQEPAAGRYANYTAPPADDGINFARIGRGLSGLGAGIQGRGAEFSKGLREDRAQRQKLRQEALITDTMYSKRALDSGNMPSFLNRMESRIDAGIKMGMDMTDSVQLYNLAGTDPEAAKAQVNEVYMNLVDRGLVKAPETTEGSYKIQEIGGKNYRVNNKTGEMDEIDPVGNKAKEDKEKISKQNALFADLSTLDRTIDNIDDAYKLADVAGGEYYLLKDMPGSLGGNSKILNATLQPIIAALGFDKLQDMRNKSPTGGALGQVSNIELNMLQSAVESLVMAAETSPAELRAALTNVKESYTNYKAALLGKTAQVDWNKYPEYVIEVDGQRYWSNPKDENSDVFLIGPVPKKAPPKKVSPTASGES